MRNLIIAVVLFMPVFAAAQQNGKVLMIVNEAKSEDLELMLTKEVGTMKEILQQAGFEVVVSTGSSEGSPIASCSLE
jgi:hypothetical protein